MTTSLGRADMSSESLARENRHQAERCAELERKIDLLELNCTKAENARDAARRSMAEFVSRTSMAMGYESLASDSPAAVDVVVSKASEMHQVNVENVLLFFFVTNRLSHCINTTTAGIDETSSEKHFR